MRKPRPFACLALILFVAVGTKGQCDEIKVTTVPIPIIKLPPEKPPTREEAAHIRKLIASLAEIDSPDFGLSPTMSGMAFAPIAGSEEVGMMVLANHRLKRSRALTELVKLGAKAMPFLLEALDDKTPTKLIVKREGIITGTWYGREVWGNKANKEEQKALASLGPRDDPFSDSPMSHTVTVGDVCLVVIGQITGRAYSAVRYQPSGNIVFNSPTHDSAITRAVRAIWSSNHPIQHLFDSLLLDYSSRGVLNGQSLDGWDVGNDLQVAAVMRLLFYFPEQTAPLIAERIDCLIVSNNLKGKVVDKLGGPPELDFYIRRVVANGVRESEFLKAVAWSHHPFIREALWRAFQRTDDLETIRSVEPSIDSKYNAPAAEKLAVLIRKLPPDQDGSLGDYDLLTSFVRRAGIGAKPVVEEYARNARADRNAITCKALKANHATWGDKLLISMLDDKFPLHAYRAGPDSATPWLRVRVCDAAADALASVRKDICFTMTGSYEDLDRQITNFVRRPHRNRPR